MKYVLYSKECYIRGVLYTIICYIAWYILMLYIITVSYIAFNIACAGEVRAAGSIVEHGHSVALRDRTWIQRDGFQSAKEH